MITQLIIISIAIVTVSFMLLGINILFLKKKFPETEVGKNKNMMKIGLSCPKCEERRMYRKSKTSISLNNVMLKPDWQRIEKGCH